jgi:hypothetical protein
VVATNPGLAETLQRDWQKAARFYAKFGITEGVLRHGVPPGESPSLSDLLGDLFTAPADTRIETRSRGEATLPG